MEDLIAATFPFLGVKQPGKSLAGQPRQLSGQHAELLVERLRRPLPRWTPSPRRRDRSTGTRIQRRAGPDPGHRGQVRRPAGARRGRCAVRRAAEELVEVVGEPGAQGRPRRRSSRRPDLADLSGAGLGPGPAVLRLRRGDGGRDHPAHQADLRLQPEQPGRTPWCTPPSSRRSSQAPADCLVVLDEAYREYIRDEAVPDGMDLYRDRPNVAVLRTFSRHTAWPGCGPGS